MTRRVPDRPACLWCFAPLSRQTWPAPADVQVGDTLDGFPGEPVVEVLRRSDGGRLGAGSTVWLGRVGRYGDGRFCGLNCGYRWARENAPHG